MLPSAGTAEYQIAAETFAAVLIMLPSVLARSGSENSPSAHRTPGRIEMLTQTNQILAWGSIAVSRLDDLVPFGCSSNGWFGAPLCDPISVGWLEGRRRARQWSRVSAYAQQPLWPV